MNVTAKTSLYDPILQVSASTNLTEAYYPITPKIMSHAELEEKERERKKNDKMRLKIKRVDMIRGKK